jgi:hypothetical protein
LTAGNTIKTTNITAGLGLSYGYFNLDYAYFKDGVLDANTTHFFTISFVPEVKKSGSAIVPAAEKKPEPAVIKEAPAPPKAIEPQVVPSKKKKKK